MTTQNSSQANSADIGIQFKIFISEKYTRREFSSHMCSAELISSRFITLDHFKEYFLVEHWVTPWKDWKIQEQFFERQYMYQAGWKVSIILMMQIKLNLCVW